MKIISAEIFLVSATVSLYRIFFNHPKFNEVITRFPSRALLNVADYSSDRMIIRTRITLWFSNPSCHAKAYARVERMRVNLDPPRNGWWFPEVPDSAKNEAQNDNNIFVCLSVLISNHYNESYSGDLNFILRYLTDLRFWAWYNLDVLHLLKTSRFFCYYWFCTRAFWLDQNTFPMKNLDF